jgi:ribosomal protein S18 acetylase RimI-like enzyme
VPDLVAIEAFLRRAPYLHCYELGDLDPREREHCEWIAADPLRAVALVYRGLATPTLIAFADGEVGAVRALLAGAIDRLPARCYAHLSPGLVDALAPRFTAEQLGHNLKMAFVGPPERAADPGVILLSAADAREVAAFYAEAYPGSYFEPVNLVRGPYLAVRDAHGLAAVAGVHVYSPALRVAALGNIATRPDARGRGHARRVTTALCRRLAAEADVIALNVRADNAAAIACYRGVGFEVRHAYEEWRLAASGSTAGTPEATAPRNL